MQAVGHALQEQLLVLTKGCWHQGRPTRWPSLNKVLLGGVLKPCFLVMVILLEESGRGKDTQNKLPRVPAHLHSWGLCSFVKPRKGLLEAFFAGINFISEDFQSQDSWRFESETSHAMWVEGGSLRTRIVGLTARRHTSSPRSQTVRAHMPT